MAGIDDMDEDERDGGVQQPGGGQEEDVAGKESGIVPDLEWVRRIYGGGLSRVNLENSVLALCNNAGRPYLREHFRDALKGVVSLQSIVALGPLRANNVYEIVLVDKAVKRKLLTVGSLLVNDHPCRLVDPEERLVVCRMHWLPFNVLDREVEKSFLNYGEVVAHVREKSVVAGMKHCYTNVRRVTVRLRPTCSVDDIPDMIQVAGLPSLVAIRTAPLVVCIVYGVDISENFVSVGCVCHAAAFMKVSCVLMQPLLQ
jgi:hypothetical protein